MEKWLIFVFIHCIKRLIECRMAEEHIFFSRCKLKFSTFLRFFFSLNSWIFLFFTIYFICYVNNLIGFEKRTKIEMNRFAALQILAACAAQRTITKYLHRMFLIENVLKLKIDCNFFFTNFKTVFTSFYPLFSVIVPDLTIFLIIFRLFFKNLKCNCSNLKKKCMLFCKNQ